jgi:hypothetical protein
MANPKVFVYVEGGVIQTILSDQPIDILVLDGDVEGIDGYETYTEPDGTSFQARIGSDGALVNKKAVKHYFKQVK